MKVKNLKIRPILATNCKETIEVELETQKGIVRASVPMGTSKGKYEVHYLPVFQVIKNFSEFKKNFVNKEFNSQEEVDLKLKTLDGTSNFGMIGGNLALAISSVFLKAFALERGQEVFEYFKGRKMPKPLSNVAGGWGEESEIQEFLLLPEKQKSFKDVIFRIASAYLDLGSMLKQEDDTFKYSKNYESGWVTNLSTRRLLELLSDVCAEHDLRIGMDVAASDRWDGNTYLGRSLEEYKKYITKLIEDFKIVFIEDPFHQDDFDSFAWLTRKVSPRLVCIPKGHSIITRDGIKDISEIKIDDYVLSHDGKFHVVEEVFKRPFSGNLIEISPHIIKLPIKLTPNHPVLVVRPLRTKNRVCKLSWKCVNRCRRVKKWEWKPQWVPASNIRTGDYLLFPILKEPPVQLVLMDKIEPSHYLTKPVPNPLLLTSEFVELCGYYVAEGSSGSQRSIQFSLGLHERKLAERITSLINKTFLLDSSIYEDVEKSYLKVNTNSIILHELFRSWFGTNAYEKKLPEWIIKLKPELLRKFINALWSGDGYKFRYTTVSKTLALQLFVILTKLGIIPTLHEYSQSKNAYGKKIYCIDVMSKYHQKFAGLRGIPVKSNPPTKYRHFFVKDGYVWMQVQNVRKVPFKGYVHNLRVKGSNSYICEGITVHNCGDDLYATNPDRLIIGIERGATNSILIKPNQIGTITDTINVINIAKRNKMVTVMSHRSGTTDETLLCHLAVGLNCDFVKFGISGERIVKINELLRIEDRIRK